MMKFYPLLACFWILTATFAQDTKPGLALTLTDKNGNSDSHSVSLAALYVRSDEPASPFIEKGEYTASWSGYLNLEKRSRLYFSFSGNGAAELKIDGETLHKENGKLGLIESERHRLSSGLRKLELKYRAPASGPSGFRLYWRGRDFARETIPAKVFLRDAGVLLGDGLREGRNLFGTSGCVHCHKGKELSLISSMPELLQKGPSFKGIGSRLNKSWMASWIRDPKAHRPTARMPKLFHGEDENSINDIAEWLASQTDISPSPIAPSSPKSIEQGQKLFNELGCIGCHDTIHTQKPTTDTDHSRIPLIQVGNKFKPGALRDFLIKPGKHYPWIRMPDFALNEQEATQLSHYLRSISDQKRVKAALGNQQKGKEFAQEKGCFNCHSEEPTPFTAPELSSLNLIKGCLSDGNQNSPDYNFSSEDRKSIRQFIKTSQNSLHQRSLREFAIRQTSSLQCASCHQSSGKPSRLSTLKEFDLTNNQPSGNEEREVHPVGKKIGPPDLTLIGEKLRADWMKELFNGELSYKPRPWMKMRMPSFPARAELLADGIAHSHGFPPKPEAPLIQPELQSIGEKLVSTDGGFACVACHAVGKKPALAPFEGQGLNFSYSKERLNHEYYLRWMLNPQRISPQSIMPRYSDDEGFSTLADILEGNATHQFNAIWKYLVTGKDL